MTEPVRFRYSASEPAINSPDVAAGAEPLPRDDVEAAERERQERDDAGEQQRRADQLRVGRVRARGTRSSASR